MENLDAVSISRVESESRAFIRRVYNWMTAGLAATGLLGWYMAANPPLIIALIRTPVLFYGLMIAELLMVLSLAGWVQRMSATTAALVFMLYAGLNGITLSAIFLAYTASTITTAFLVTAGTFAAMSLYGYATKTDLTSMGNLCFMGLIGIILASLVNLFLNNSAVYWITTYLGIAIFVGLTAYDTQKLKNMARAGEQGSDTEKKGAIAGALMLYLDFINLFLMILRVLGRRR